MRRKGWLRALVVALLVSMPLHAEIISARTEQQVLEEELTPEAALAKLRDRGIDTGRVAPCRLPPDGWWRALSALGVRAAFRS